MEIVTIVEDNPITGVRYGTVEIPEYNNNIQRRLNRYHRLRDKVALIKVHSRKTKTK